LSLAMQPTSSGEFVTARPAATVLLVRDGPDGLQVFMVVRHHKIDFASGALVFPGGKVEDEDISLAGGDTELASRLAAIRETFEECGVMLAPPSAVGESALATETTSYRELLDARDWRSVLDALTPFAHWITPPILPKRFDTRFYIVAAPSDQAAAHDGGEAVDSVWIEPARALAEAAEGRRTLVLATRLNLELLGRSASAAEAIAAAAARRVVTVEPRATKTETGYRLTIPLEAGYGGPDFYV
jgi:8-oxo-dGTP pyrophosphatase MutT (NUDIX family)